MDYFYTPPSSVTPPRLVIQGEEFVHLTHVMRKKAGDTFRVVDGCGTSYEVVCESIERRSASCSILRTEAGVNEPAIELILGVGILKNGARFDFLVEKAVEIGVRTIVPLRTERTIPAHARVERWQKLALAAMKQSGRSVLPDISALTRFDDFLHSTQTRSRKFLLHEKAQGPSLREVAGGCRSATAACIGPEGGFSEDEVDLATQAGYLSVGLGPRRMRTETAALIAASLILV